jgi:DnaJ-class molecular chaperone
MALLLVAWTGRVYTPSSRRGSSSAGVCLLCCREGDAVTKGVPPGPLVLVLASAPHPVFSRRGARDLKAKVKLPLLTALTGGCVRLDTLDGR